MIRPGFAVQQAVNFEVILISRVLETGDLKAAIKRKITEDFFFLPDTRAAFTWLLGHFRQYGEVPSLAMFQAEFPEFLLHTTSDSVESLADRVRTSKLNRDLAEMLEEGVRLTRENPHEALDHFRSAVAGLTAAHVVSRDVDLTQTTHETLAEYERVKQGQGMLGIPWPWAKLNETTLGIQNEELIFFYGRPKSCKCVVAGERVMQPNGDLTPIEDLPEVCVVPSYTAATGRFRWAEARRVQSGRKEAVSVTLQSGMRLRSGDRHLYLTPDGYRRICDLSPGDFVATTQQTLSWTGTSLMTTEVAYFLGLLTGDGNYTRNEVQYTTKDPELLHAVQQGSALFGCFVHQGSRAIEYRITGRAEQGVARKGVQGNNGVLNWLRGLGVAPARSEQKRIPSAVWTASFPALCAYLAGLLDTDGTIGRRVVSWVTTSEGMARDLQQALLRLGVRATVKERDTNFETRAWTVSVFSAEQHRLLFDALGKYLRVPRKHEALALKADAEGFEKRNVNGIPITPRLRALIEHVRGGRKWPISRAHIYRSSGCVSRDMLRRLADAWAAPALLTEANTAIQWEKIQSIESLGKLPCYDVCIEDGLDPNYVAEGFVIHNTWLLILSAVHAFRHGHRPLFITREMPTDQIRRRVCAVWAGLDYQAIRAGKLTASEERRYKEDLEAFAENPPFILSGDDDEGGAGVTSLAAKIQEYTPDLVFVDGVYLMRDDRGGKKSSDWQAISNIMQDLKSLAKRVQLPIIGTTQANRSGDKGKGQSLSEIAFSDGIAQSADYVIRIIYDRKEKESQEAVLTLPGIRESAGCTFTVNMRIAQDFSQRWVADTQVEEDELMAGTTDEGVIR